MNSELRKKQEARVVGTLYVHIEPCVTLAFDVLTVDHHLLVWWNIVNMLHPSAADLSFPQLNFNYISN